MAAIGSRSLRKLMGCGAVGATMLASPVASASFMDALEGSWRGAGTALVAPVGNISARCTLDVSVTGGKSAFDGVCRKGPFRRSLSLQLTSRDGVTYSGTYDGTRAGAARLTGRRDGDTLSLTITWPKPVNGDRTATLVLKNRSGGRLQQRVFDIVDGSTVVTSDFTFTRR